jgi:predicted RNase H-like HicB family nuclease
MIFLVVIHKDDRSDYGVTVPGLPGCFSAGDTIEELVENTKEAIALHLEGSNPTLLSLFKDFCTGLMEIYEHMNNSQYKGGMFVLLEVNL